MWQLKRFLLLLPGFTPTLIYLQMFDDSPSFSATIVQARRHLCAALISEIRLLRFADCLAQGMLQRRHSKLQKRPRLTQTSTSTCNRRRRRRCCCSGLRCFTATSSTLSCFVSAQRLLLFQLSVLDASLSNLVLIQTAAFEISVTTSVYTLFAPFMGSVEISPAPHNTLL